MHDNISNPFEAEDGRYVVLLNDDGQYSVWPAEMPIPAGWRCVGASGGRQACLEFIDATWTVMRRRTAPGEAS